MKAILKPVSPKLCEKVISGECTLLLSKTRPKLEPPFRDYIYMTLAKPYCYEFAGGGKMKAKNGKVIGEFVCDRIYEIAPINHAPDDIEVRTCLTREEIVSYHKGYCYGWHISELKIYDKPKELGEFRKPSKEYHEIFEKEGRLIFADGWTNEPITRAPQGWCYVEELEEL